MTSKPLLSDRGRSYDSTAPQAPSYAAVAAPASSTNSTSTPARNGNSSGSGNGDLLPSHTGRKKGWLATQLRGNLDPNKCDWISVYGCLLTGFTSAVSFTVSCNVEMR